MKRVFLAIALLAMGCVVWQGCVNARGDEGGTGETEGDKPVRNKFDWQPLAYDSTKQYIYLSFDDGPQHGTLACYELCRRERIKASFFMVGLHSAMKSDGPKIVTTVRESYPDFLLANHSYSHARGRYRDFYLHPGSAELDFLKAQDSMHVPYRIARLPGNNAWAETGAIKASWLTRPIARLLDSAGYYVIGWDVEWHFNKRARPVQTPGQLAAEVDSAFANNRTHTPRHLVILTHDRMFQHPSDADSLAKFIGILKQNPRYVFETLDHYPGVRGRK
ncbi:polysaccharide deacetylase family protein [Sediminibacterium soli]|uniref:polysaccharide deacetylase family protein n=1 Tax=Sediminibacterium soli TaxID=2698829 RepID=UPI00137A1613|nr:polysaccharide deacetylase family protein [Sediminibacterium soli]NCI47552.1 polysaccharide deacetylase family protein [Sediminibacterium soli]